MIAFSLPLTKTWINDMPNDDDITVRASAGGGAVTGVAQTKDPLDGERDNPRAITAMMERYDVDRETATEMWHRVIDTVAKLRERAAATGKKV